MVPARVLSVEPDVAIVAVAGRHRRAFPALPEPLMPGDWVVIAGDTIVRRVDPDQAEQMARAFRVATGADSDDKEIDP